MSKFIFVTGGVVSGIGKGISAASVGRLLKANGYSVFMQKFDPYLNIDPGTMSPYQHGEVFVTRDGGETDLDLGHYERFIDEELTKNSSITSGRIYNSVIRKERAGEYSGKTVQVIPHITDAIKEKVFTVAKESQADFIITEVGGTIGDIESQPFIEAIRQIHSANPQDVLFMHTVLIPEIPGSDELKTKPAQHSHKELMSLGIKPDVFILRAPLPITEDVIDKISLFCDIPKEAIIESRTVDLIYEVPLVFHEQNLDSYILKQFGMEAKQTALDEWQKMCNEFKSAKDPVDIALVGKYTRLPDAYLSVNEALYDAGYNQGAKVTIHYFDSEKITEENVGKQFQGIDGIIIPGGFGERGTEGMLHSIRYAREHNVPFFGICFGMQMALLEAARNQLGWKDATSTEFHKHTTHPIIHLMSDQEADGDIGGTLRLGNWECHLKSDSRVREIYGKTEIVERHRHRYEFNNKFKQELKKTGITFSGKNMAHNLVEIIERSDQEFFIACQYHPEFKSRPNRPHPLFMGFVQASLKNRKGVSSSAKDERIGEKQREASEKVDKQ